MELLPRPHLMGLQRLLQPYTMLTLWKLQMSFMDFVPPKFETFRRPYRLFLSFQDLKQVFAGALWKNLTKFTKKTPMPDPTIKIWFRQRCVSGNFAKFFRRAFLKNIFKGLLTWIMKLLTDFWYVIYCILWYF